MHSEIAIQDTVKIYTKSIRTFIWINLFSFTSLFTFSAKAIDNETQILMKNLGGGINLSLYENYWKSVPEILAEDINADLENIAYRGFKTLRLPVAFDLFLQPQSSNIQPEMLAKLDFVYEACTQLKLNLIIAYHYGKLTNDNYPQEIERISWIWKQVQNRFKGKGYNNLLFELYNEPVIARENWKQAATTLIHNLRYEDKDRYYIVGGTNYNNIEELREIGNLKDNKTLYTFHFYDPYIFTHQGADWTAEKTYIRDLPYPYKKQKMPVMPDRAKGTPTERDYTKYNLEATKPFIQSRLKSIATFCAAYDMPLICTETGVINLAKQKDRSCYLHDLTMTLYELNVPVVLWDYNQKFTILRTKTKVLKGLKTWLKRTK